jgi:hypothetical protein
VANAHKTSAAFPVLSCSNDSDHPGDFKGIISRARCVICLPLRMIPAYKTVVKRWQRMHASSASKADHQHA